MRADVDILKQIDDVSIPSIEDGTTDHLPKGNIDKALDKNSSKLDRSIDTSLYSHSEGPSVESKKLSKKEGNKIRRKRKKNRDESEITSSAAEPTEAGTASQTRIEENEEPIHLDMSAWTDLFLDRRIMHELARLGFVAPTHIQAECLPAAIRDRRDIIGAAQTGSGKTLAFGLPIINFLASKDHSHGSSTQQGSVSNESTKTEEMHRCLQALVLAPTRELALQVAEHMKPFARACDVRVVPVVGGLSAVKQERLLAKRPQVVIATPGRLWDLMKGGESSYVRDLANLRFLVVDEADRMVQRGNYAELTSIFDEIMAAKRLLDRDSGDDDGARQHGPPLQTSVFSATLTLPSSLRRRLRKGGGGSSGSASLGDLMDRVPFAGAHRPKVVDLTTERRLADRVRQAYVSCPELERDEYLYYLLVAHPGRTIVFVNAISSVRRLAAVLRLLGLPAHPLHSGMQQRARLKSLDRFKADDNAVLLATDVAARGLDVKDVRCVIHYQLPASVDTYVHRCGRTARADAEGLALALVTPKEDGRFKSLIRHLYSKGDNDGREENTVESVSEFPLDPSVLPEVRQRVALALTLDSVERRQKKSHAELTWKRQHAEELEIDLSDDDMLSSEEHVKGDELHPKRTKQKKKKKKKNTAEASALREELAALLSKPLQPSFSRKYFTGGAVAGVAVQQRLSALVGSSSGTVATSHSADKGDERGIIKSEDGTAAIVSAAVSMATAQVEVSQAGRSRRRNQANGGGERAVGKKNKTSKRPARMTREAALKAAIRKHIEKKGKRKRPQVQGMVVVGQSAAFGRSTNGPDALEALRARFRAVT